MEAYPWPTWGETQPTTPSAQGTPPIVSVQPDPYWSNFFHAVPGVDQISHVASATWNVAKSPDAIIAAAGFVPVVGNVVAAVNDFSKGHYIWGVVDVGFIALDEVGIGEGEAEARIAVNVASDLGEAKTAATEGAQVFGTAEDAVRDVDSLSPSGLEGAGGARFHGEPFAFGNGARSARVTALVDEAARASGVNLSALVDEVVYDSAGSYFTFDNGKRILAIGDSAFARTAEGQLIEAAHELVHAQQFDRFAARGGFASLDDAAAAFFDNVPDAVYARQERVAELLARARINQYLGGLSPQQWGGKHRVH